MLLCHSFANPPVACLVRDKLVSLSLFCYNTNVTVVLNLCDAVSNFYNLLLLVPVSEDQPHISLHVALCISF